jgi:hypothetical protein
MRPGKNLPAELVLLTQQQQAFELRKMGYDYNKIGRMMGISHAKAFKLCDEFLTLTKEEVTETAEAVRAMEIARLDAIVEAHWPMRSVVKSADVIMKTMERRARYIGLDAPSTDLLDAATSLREFLQGAKTNIGIPTDPDPDPDPEPENTNAAS